MSRDLGGWIDRQWQASAAGLLLSVSPHLRKSRPGFAQTITARAGAIVASPVLASYDPEPDYFFHWYRDAALVIDALRLIRNDEALRATVETAFGDFVRFSLELLNIDGSVLAGSDVWRSAVKPEFVQYLRTAEELRGVRGLAVSADTRVNPDGTLDLSRWARPQHDGPALRALALLRWLNEGGHDKATNSRAATLLLADLEFVERLCLTSCFDIWEEELGLHYYTLRVAAAALEGGSAWLCSRGGDKAAAACRQQAQDLLSRLDLFWREADGYYSSRTLPDGRLSDKDLDIAVLLACLHAKDPSARHGLLDPKVQATFERLVRLFAAEYPINHGHEEAPAMGRYANDRYISGGPYFFSTLGAAQFCYRRAALDKDRHWFERGDLFLKTVHRYTPDDHSMSEQFDGTTGAPRSARHLAWSYAAFLTCMEARRELPYTT